MKCGFFSDQWSDPDGNFAGGVSTGRGFTISWQNGPLGKGVDRREPNGAFVEDIIDAARDRLEFYQKSKFCCADNEQAIAHLQRALAILDRRTKDREERGVEGTYGQ